MNNRPNHLANRATNLLLAILPVLLFSGCATYDPRIDDIDARLSRLEKSANNTPAKNNVRLTGEQAQEASLEETSTAEKIIIPETPSKEDVQAALKKAGYYEGAIDGKYGPVTKKAIQNFQNDSELNADGKIGPNTWDKLKKYYVPTENTAE